MEGLVLVNKPKGVTSHDVVDVVRRSLLRQGYGRVKVGHAGTLDPNATGLLIVGVGREATRRLGGIAKSTKKTYEAEIVLGARSSTDDVEGRIISKKVTKRLSKKGIEDTLEKFVGEQEQIPPQYSAIKLKGRKAYELARKGEKFQLEPRRVTIYSIKLLDYRYPVLKIECEVSAGTYIRALARDIGEKLGVGAYLKNLRRTRIGSFKLEDAIALRQFEVDSGSGPE